jgi:hypothetical protein
MLFSPSGCDFRVRKAGSFDAPKLASDAIGIDVSGSSSV